MGKAMSWCLLALGALGPTAQAAPGAQAGVAATSEAAVEDPLARRPADLPVATQGKWRRWTRDSAPVPTLMPLLRSTFMASRQGDFPATVDGLWQCLEQVPDYPPVLHQLGVTYFKLRRYGDAKVCFERFLGVTEGTLDMTRALGHCYYSLGDYELAHAHYTKVLALQPRSPETRFGLALAEMRLGREEVALALLDEVLLVHEGHVDARIWRAQLLFDAGEVEAALAATERASEIAPFEPRPWFIAARALFELERDDEAEQARERHAVLDRAAQSTRTLQARLALSPRDASALRSLGLTRHSIGDLEGARSALERLIQLDPKDTDSNVLALDVFESLGDTGAASQAAHALSVNCAEDPRAWLRLVSYWKKRGNSSKALEAALRFTELGGDPRVLED